MITSEYKTYIEDVQGVLFMARQQFDNEQTTKDLFRIGTTEFVNFDIDEWTDEVSNYICIKLTQKAKEKPDTAFYLCELKQMFEAERHATERKIGSDEFDRDKQIIFGVKFYSDYQTGQNESRKFAKCIDLAIEQLQGESKGMTPPPKKHNLPTIDTNKFNSDKIYETYNNVVFKCSKGCFNALLVDGFEHKDKIEFILKGRKSTKTDKETLQYAQLRKFIETITGNKELTKDAYYQTIFGLKIKTSSYETATTLNNTFKDLKLNRLTK